MLESNNFLKHTKQLDTAHRLVSRYGELLMWKYAEFDGFMVSVPIYSKSKKRKIRIVLINDLNLYLLS